MEPILKVSDRTKTFEDRKRENFSAVDHVSFHVMPGQTLGIVGESGSGKSTLARLLCCLEEPDGGTLSLCGKEIGEKERKKNREVCRKIQMVFQDPVSSFDPRRTLGEGIGESLRNAGVPRKEAEKRVRQLLEQCGLPEEFAKRYPHEVSGGQCQRAAIARALAVKPKVLICDEATSALDVTVQKEILELLHTLRSEQGTKLSILFICHDISLVQQFCDRVLVMYHGDIVEQGTPIDVICHPQNDYTQRLIDSIL